MKEKELEELLAAERLASLDWEAIGKELAAAQTGLEKRIAKARAKPDGRIAAGKKRKQLNAKRRRAREWKRRNDARIRAEKIEAIPLEGRWPWLKERHGKLLLISREEWDENVELALGESWIEVRRYDTSKPLSLENIYVLDMDSQELLWDGAEHRLRELGYIL